MNTRKSKELKIAKIYRNAFKIMINAFKTDNIYDAINEVINDLQTYIKASAIILYRIDGDNIRYFASNDCDINSVSKIINYNKKNILKKNDFMIFNTKTDKISTFPVILTDNQKYILCVVNNQESNKFIEKHSLKIYSDAFKTILDKMESLYQLQRQSEEDFLTKSGNRTSYEKDLNNIMDSSFIYTLIDLFRLKYVNDNINHAAGDEYIKNVAILLQKYFPKQDTDNIENYIYRIGGDEFVLISKNNSKEKVKKQLEQLKQELNDIEIGNSEVILGVNYGIVEKTTQETIEELYRESDIYLYKDKNKMYRKLKIDRRK